MYKILIRKLEKEETTRKT